MSWPIPPLVQKPLPVPPRTGRWLAALFVVVGLATILTLLFWPIGASRRVPLFWVCTPVFPALLWVLVLIVRLVVFMVGKTWQEAANREKRDELTRWHRWARSRMALLASGSITPETDLVDRLTGVKTPAPFNPGRVLKLGQFAGKDRQAGLLEALLKQVAPALSRISGPVAVHVYLSGEPSLAKALKLLEAAWDGVRIGARPDFDIQPMLPVLPKRWLEEQNPNPHLVLGIQLTPANADAVATESGFALLLAQPGSKPANTVPPVAWLYRGMPSAEGTTEADLAQLLDIQKPARPVQALWSMAVPQVQQDALLEAATTHNLELERGEGLAGVCVLDQALGPCGAAGSWLAIAIATETFRSSKQAGLVAMTANSKTTFHLIEPA